MRLTALLTLLLAAYPIATATMAVAQVGSTPKPTQQELLDKCIAQVKESPSGSQQVQFTGTVTEQLAACNTTLRQKVASCLQVLRALGKDYFSIVTPGSTFGEQLEKCYKAIDDPRQERT